ncbi:MAG: hypothetical protein ACK5VH_02170, partial [bacterium]
MHTLIARIGFSLLVMTGWTWPVSVSAQSADRPPSVNMRPDSTLDYFPDERGNLMPDFSRVGYHQGDLPIPDADVRIEIAPS